MFGGDGAKADDELDAVRNCHIKLYNLCFRDQNEEARCRVGGGRYENGNHFLRAGTLHLVVLFAGEKSYGMHAQPWVFYHHHGLEGILVAGSESFIYLLGRAIEFVEQRHPKQGEVNPFN